MLAPNGPVPNDGTSRADQRSRTRLFERVKAICESQMSRISTTPPRERELWLAIIIVGVVAVVWGIVFWVLMSR